MLIAFGVPQLALAAPLCDRADRADRTDATTIDGISDVDVAFAPRCDPPPAQPAQHPIILDCRDDTNPIFSAAVGICDQPATEGAPQAAPAQPAPTHGPLLCDGPSCLPMHAPLASDTQFNWGAPPLVGAAVHLSIILPRSALSSRDAGGPRAGWRRRIDRPPRA